MSKKIMITSRSFANISREPIEILENAGYEVVFKAKNFNQQEFEETIREYDALVIGAHPFPAEVMKQCSKLQIICKHGAGLDNIPLDAAKETGITVCNAPGTNSNAVADLTMGLMLSLCRKISAADNSVHRGEWKPIIGVDVFAKTLGLLGFGAIAKNVARRAKGFGMKVLAYDPYVTKVPDEFADFVTLCSFEDVLKGSDIVSLHLPLTRETRNMLAEKELLLMKQGSYIINASRGGILNEKALADALASGHLAGAALDVSEKEPPESDNPLLSMENVIITPHIGMYSKEAIDAISLICAQNAAAKATGGLLQFQVIS